MNTKRIREQKYFSLCWTCKTLLDSADKLLLLVINQCPDTWHVMHSRHHKNWRVLSVWRTGFYCVLGEVNFFFCRKFSSDVINSLFSWRYRQLPCPLEQASVVFGLLRWKVACLQVYRLVIKNGLGDGFIIALKMFNPCFWFVVYYVCLWYAHDSW